MSLRDKAHIRMYPALHVFFKYFVALSNYLPPPTITSDSKFFSMEGNTFQLTCHIEVPGTTPYHAVFIHKGEEMKTNDYAVVSDLEHEKNETRKARLNLTITESIKERDEGDYKCTVMDYHKNTNSFTATMEFVTDPVVTLRPLNTEVTTEKGRKQAAFTVEYTAFPAASFYIYDPRNEQISCDMDVMNRQKYDVIIKDESVKFVVKRPDLNDFGNYTIVATTVGQNFTKTLRLIVSGKMKICALKCVDCNLYSFCRETNREHGRRLRSSWRGSQHGLQDSRIPHSDNFLVIPAMSGSRAMANLWPTKWIFGKFVT